MNPSRRYIPPDELTATQRTTLVRVRRHFIERRKHGWGMRGDGRTISLATANKLERLGLLTQERKNGRIFLKVTALGAATCDTIENRARTLTRRRERA